MREISLKEVEKASMDMPKGKSLGPDGFTTEFFHVCWFVKKQDVWEAVEDSIKFFKFLPTLNFTFLTVIPKEDKVEDPNRFRPISLCNVIYKIISKVIENCLKPLLPLLIS